MGFPFIAPLKETVVAKLKKREEEEYKQKISTTFSPFAILSSGAVVVRANTPQDVKKLINTGAWPKETDAYYGCVVANSTEVKNTYQTGNTIAGYDLNGQPIYVPGEENRRVSTPIIQSIEIDTDGNNNTLKTAKVNIKVFTLKQLEMFEMFFLRPSMDVVLEFGYNSDIRGSAYNQVQQHLFVGQGYTYWQTKFLKQFSHRDNAYREAKANYLKILKDTDYNYDFFAGKVLNFMFNPTADGTYDIQLEISAGNELQMWVPLKQSSPVGKLAKASRDATESYKQWMNVIAADVNLPKLVYKTDVFTPDYIKSELFNWGIINTDEKDTNVSKDPYISFRFILDIMNTAKTMQTYKGNVISPFYFEDKARSIPIMPVSSHDNIMSTNTSFILPGLLPAIFIADLPNKLDQIVLDTTRGHKSFINGKSFNIKSKEFIYDSDGNEIPIKGLTIGNLYNVFIKYETFVRIFNQSYTQGDVINELLAEVNSNMFGLCKLELQKETDDATSSPLTICDRKLKNIIQEFDQKAEPVYRFRIGPIGSIIQDFSFNMEMSELMQGQAMFAQEYDMLKVMQTGKTDNIRTVKEIEEYSAADLSFRPNFDGYCSINKISYELNKDYREWQTELGNDLKVTGEKPPTQNTEDSLQQLNKVLKGNYIKFKLNASDRQNTSDGINHLIYTDPALVQHYIPKRQNGTTVLTFLDIKLVIDGMSGLSCGEYFQVDGVPEIYNENGYFQITNVKHDLADNQWKTAIEASYLLKSIDVDEDIINLNDGKAYKERIVIEPQPPSKPKPPENPPPRPSQGSSWADGFYKTTTPDGTSVTIKVPPGYYIGTDGKEYPMTNSKYFPGWTGEVVDLNAYRLANLPNTFEIQQTIKDNAALAAETKRLAALESQDNTLISF